MVNIVCAPSGIVDMERPWQGISDIAGAGFENVLLDMAMCCSAGELENWGKELQEAGQKRAQSRKKLLVSEHPEELYNRMKLMLDRCRKENLHIHIGRVPYLLRNTKQRDMGELLLRLAQESIQVCGKAGCRYVIVRPLFSCGKQEEGWAANREYYLCLAETARENHVTILLENQCRDVNGHLIRGICAEGEEAAQWVDKLNQEAGEERFGFCMDTGVCSLCGQDMQEFALSLGKRIRAVILRDCDGHTESAMLPFTCVAGGQPQTDWLGLIRGLREIGFDGQLILNFSDTAGVFSPILRPGLMQLAKSTAEYFGWQIGLENLLKKYSSIVLFGAGNMCRNYMKCYGDKYPPLYTCDNDKSVWGTEFCGLTVKNPQELKELPEDCAIFVCNIYYREIRKQLLEMGVKNPIEYFNDEYMPSFY